MSASVTQTASNNFACAVANYMLTPMDDEMAYSTDNIVAAVANYMLIPREHSEKSNMAHAPFIDNFLLLPREPETPRRPQPSFIDSPPTAFARSRAPSPDELRALGMKKREAELAEFFGNKEEPKRHIPIGARTIEDERHSRQLFINMGGRVEDFYKDGFVSCITSLQKEKERAIREAEANQTTQTATIGKSSLIKKITGLTGYGRWSPYSRRH